MLYGGKPFSSKVTKNMNAGHAERGGDGAGGGHGPSARPPPARSSRARRRGRTAGRPGPWLKSPVSSSRPVSPASDQHARRSPSAQPGAGERDRRPRFGSATAAVAERVEERRARRPQCASVMRRRYGCRSSRPGDLGRTAAPLWNTPAMSDWPPAAAAAAVGAVRSARARAGGWPATVATTRPSRRPGAPATAAPAGLHRLHAVRARGRPGHQHQRPRHRVDGARDPLDLLDRIDPGPGVRLRGQGPDRALGRPPGRQGHGDRRHRARLDRRRRSWRCSSCSPLAFGDDVDDFDGINSDPSDGVCNEERFIEDPDC